MMDLDKSSQIAPDEPHTMVALEEHESAPHHKNQPAPI